MNERYQRRKFRWPVELFCRLLDCIGQRWSDHPWRKRWALGIGAALFLHSLVLGILPRPLDDLLRVSGVLCIAAPLFYHVFEKRFLKMSARFRHRQAEKGPIAAAQKEPKLPSQDIATGYICANAKCEKGYNHFFRFC